MYFKSKYILISQNIYFLSLQTNYLSAFLYYSAHNTMPNELQVRLANYFIFDCIFNADQIN